jgi:hypothetical protein
MAQASAEPAPPGRCRRPLGGDAAGGAGGTYDCGAGGVIYILKLSPQPQRSRSLGLLKRKPSFNPSRTKSSWVPSM